MVYLFSTILLGDSQAGTAQNDFRPFLAAHPGIKPVMEYSYAGRRPSIIMFKIERKE
jgi:hypothetical protein